MKAKTIKSLFVATTLALSGCAWDEQIRNMTPEQRSVLVNGLLGMQAMQNQREAIQAQQNNNWLNAEMNGIGNAGMIGRANNPVYVCSYYGCP